MFRALLPCLTALALCLGAAGSPSGRWDDLKGLRTGLVIGVSMGPEFDQFLQTNTRVERVQRIESMLKMMAKDRIDIVPFGWEAGTIAIERSGFAGEIVPLQ